MPRDPRILIVRTDRIGDVVLTTPAIHALRRSYPKAFLSILVSPLTRDLVHRNPDLDEVLLDDRGGEHQGLSGFWKLVRHIQQKKFDRAIVFHTKRRTNLLCFLAGIPQRVGYANDKHGFLLTERIPDERSRGLKHEAEYCLEVLKVLGVTDHELKCFVPLHEECEAWVDHWMAGNRISPSENMLAIHPGASDQTKEWPAERFHQLAEALLADYPCRIVLVGGRDSTAAQKIMTGAKDNVMDLTGKTTVGQLISLLKRCRLLISNDSGPVHVASAVVTPVVSIFTRNQPGINPERWRPLGENSRIVVTPFDGDVSFAKGEVRDARYLNAISVETVWQAVDAVLKVC